MHDEITLLLNTGAVKEGLSLLRYIIHKQPENTEALYFLGSLRMLKEQDERYNLVDEYFQKALADDPDNPHRSFTKAKALELLENYREAISFFGRAGNEPMLRQDSCFGIARMLQKSGNIGAAIEELRRGWNSDPSNPAYSIEIKRIFQDIETAHCSKHYPNQKLIVYVGMMYTASNYVFAELGRRLGLYMDYEGIVNAEESETGTVKVDRLTWLLKNGGITRTHLAPSPSNIALLQASPIDRIFLTVRDPRQIFLSELNYIRLLEDPLRTNEYTRALLFAGLPAGFQGMGHQERIDTFIEHRIPQLVQYLDTWWNVAHAPDTRFKVLITRFEDMKRDYDAFFRSILDFYEIPWSEFRGERYESKPGEHAFRKGDPNEWRNVLTEANKMRISELVPNDLLIRYGWDL